MALSFWGSLLHAYVTIKFLYGMILKLATVTYRIMMQKPIDI